MSSLVGFLGESPPRLIFSPPRNDPELVRAALAGGAEAIKVHVHARHQAAGTGFGDVHMEGSAIERIRGLADVPMGVVVGDASSMVTPAELKQLARMGIDFIDAYTRHLPAWVLRECTMERMGALAPEDTSEEWGPIAGLFDCVEAAVMPHERYGTVLTAYDLALYGRVRAAVRGRLVVPTQLALDPRDVPVLAGMGMDAIMIGAVVTGRDPTMVEAACARFREACDEAASGTDRGPG